MEKIHQSSSGNQVHPIFPGAALRWQRTMTDVLYLKWTVPHGLGGNRAKNLLFSWAVLQVKSPIMARVHPWSLEGGYAWNRNSDYSLSSPASRKIQVRYTLFVGFAQLSGQEGPSLTQDSTGASPDVWKCYGARSLLLLPVLHSWWRRRWGKAFCSVLFPCPCNQKSDNIK